MTLAAASTSASIVCLCDICGVSETCTHTYIHMHTHTNLFILYAISIGWLQLTHSGDDDLGGGVHLRRCGISASGEPHGAHRVTEKWG